MSPFERLKRNYAALLEDEQRRGTTDKERELLDKLK